jgi:hypothetical protein
VHLQAVQLHDGVSLVGTFQMYNRKVTVALRLKLQLNKVPSTLLAGGGPSTLLAGGGKLDRSSNAHQTPLCSYSNNARRSFPRPCFMKHINLMLSTT